MKAIKVIVLIATIVLTAGAALAVPETGDSQVIRDWEKFYQEYFNMKKVDFSQVVIPERKSGFDRLIIVAKGMTPQKAYDTCSQKFKIWKYADDLKKVIIHENRSAKESAYAIWVRDRVEADKEHKNKSANTLKQDGVQGITLTERLLYELKYYDETGKHLDIQNITLCSGSRHSDGYVSHVYWFDGELQVLWYDPGHARDDLRSREVVS